MSGGSDADAWFHGVDPGDTEAGATAIREGSAEAPADWPAVAIRTGFARDREEYYESLQAAAIAAANAEVRERSAAGDEQLKHQIRALDDLHRVANELAERVTEWAVAAEMDVAPGIDGVAALADRAADTPTERRVVSVAARVADLRDERDALRREVEDNMHEVAPNLAGMAGPLLGARLIALAGDLESLARMPSGTIQVLGAEDALYAHLNTGSPPPKHGIIYTHEFVHGTRPEERGSASRALAGKLAIAARVDHYAGDHRPELEAELQGRIDRIRERDA